MKHHPAAEIFPMMSASELKELADDIKENGQSLPIEVLNSKILDGRNRFKACKLAGVEPAIADLDPESLGDPRQYVISLNLHRRHLSTSQRATIAATLATAKVGGPKKNRPILSNSFSEKTEEITNKQAASLLNVSTGSVKAAKKVKASGNKKLIAEVQAGAKTVNEAAKEIKPKPSKNGMPKPSSIKLATEAIRIVGPTAKRIDAIAEANGGRGMWYKAADKALNDLLDALDQMSKGKR